MIKHSTKRDLINALQSTAAQRAADNAYEGRDTWQVCALGVCDVMCMQSISRHIQAEQ